MKVQHEIPAGAASSSGVQSTEAGQLQRLNRFRSPGGAADTHDHVELSGLASRIVESGESLAAAHSKRVEALAKAYQNGTYAVQPGDLSRKLVSAMLPSKSEE